MIETVLSEKRRNVYLNFAAKSFQKQLAYKFEYFVGVLNGLLFIFVFTSLWKGIYEHSTSSAIAEGVSFSKEQMQTYAVYAILFRISMTMDDNSITQKVRTGAISMDLIKPVNFFFMSLSENLGQTMFHWFTRVIPVLMVTLVMFEAPLPTGISNYALAMVAWVFGYLIMVTLNFAVGLLAFWFIETFSFQLMKYGLITLFSGGILPIDFFPEWLKPTVAMLPFQYILYVPTSIFIGHIDGGAALSMIALQGVWVALLGLICFTMWRAGQKKLIVQGG